MLAEEQRRAEETAAKRFVDEQQRQMAAASAERIDDQLFKRPEIVVGEKSQEEKSLEKQQVSCYEKLLWGGVIIFQMSCI